MSKAKDQGWELRVQTYSGHRADEYPRRFQFGSRHLEVTEILDRWYAPEASWFKVRADDQGIYILKQHGDRWTLEGFRES